MSDFVLSLFYITFLHSLSPVQAEVIPAVLESVNSGLLIGRGGYRPRDICVSAPTGSGKTLAFVIPVIQVRRFIHKNKMFFFMLLILYTVLSNYIQIFTSAGLLRTLLFIDL